MALAAPAINYLAVLIAAVVSFFIGFVWYSFLFMKSWMKEMGIDESKAKTGKKKSMGGSMLLNFVGTLVMVYVLAMFTGFLQTTTFVEGMILGFWVWLGFFAATTLLGSVLWEMRSWKLFAINGAYWLVNLAVSAGILSVWR